MSSESRARTPEVESDYLLRTGEQIHEGVFQTLEKKSGKSTVNNISKQQKYPQILGNDEGPAKTDWHEWTVNLASGNAQ